MELNQYGRPDNWADRSVDQLLAAHAEGGMPAAQKLWDELLERDEPNLMTVVVTTGRFNQLVPK